MVSREAGLSDRNSGKRMAKVDVAERTYQLFYERARNLVETEGEEAT